jgi:hypothetical protein
MDLQLPWVIGRDLTSAIQTSIVHVEEVISESGEDDAEGPRGGDRERERSKERETETERGNLQVRQWNSFSTINRMKAITSCVSMGGGVGMCCAETVR